MSGGKENEFFYGDDCNTSKIRMSDVCVIGRVKAEYAPVLRTNLVKIIRIIPNYDGNIIGIADKVTVMENSLSPGLWTKDFCVILLHFPSMELAERWYNSDPVFKNKDFPHASASMEIIAVPLSRIPLPSHKTFQLSILQIPPEKTTQFKSEYHEKASQLFSSKDACYGVAMTNSVKDLSFGFVSRGEWIAINAFRSMDQLAQLFGQQTHEDLKAVRNCMSTTTTLAFTVS